MMLASKKNSKAIANLGDILSEKLSDRYNSTFFVPPLSKIFILDNTRQYKLPLDHDSNRVNYLLINETIPVTLFDTLLIFHDRDKKFQLQGDILKRIIEKKR